jgi:uncharacterized protein (TIGR00299 family) protein
VIYIFHDKKYCYNDNKERNFNMKTLYFDCFSGISGDMTIGALIDAGGDPIHLKNKLKKLKLEDEYELKLNKVVKNGITASKFDVVLTIHDHDRHHHHDHRSYQQIVKMIKSAHYPTKTETYALDIFRKIGEAEAKIHGVSLEDVHFHEVGAVDSIIDIVGTAILLEQLHIDKIMSAPVPVGSGSIHIDHGVYPIPAPATLEILRGIPIAESNLKGELTTPTGAAIVAELAKDFSTVPAMKVASIGYGAGTRNYPNHPNVLRVIIGDK